MKKSLRLFLAAMLMAFLSMANAQTNQWYGYARTCFNGEGWQNKFVTFNAQNPGDVQAVSETFPEILAATYLDGYVWFVTATRSLCKVPFNQETQTFGVYETVVPLLDPYNLIVDMSYNPWDGKLYFLCQDSQYSCNIKCCSLYSPSEVETVGYLNEKIWTLAINEQGEAYGVAYEGGNLYQIDLFNDAATTLVGPTGKEVWYTQGMAFNYDTGELYWAQFATSSDHGFYQVDTETGAATYLGEIGENGTQLTGLFMTPVVPEIINEVYVEGFTVPAWGEHPDYDLEVDPEAPYTLADVSWHWVSGLTDPIVAPVEFFDDESKAYYLELKFSPKFGYKFDGQVTVYINGDLSLFDLGQVFGNDYLAFTIDFHVTDPATGIADLTYDDLDGMEGKIVNIYDVMGRLVRAERYNGQFNTEALKPGVYFVNVAGRTVKLVKE